MAVSDRYFAAALPHTCTIERKGTATKDPLGHANGAWANLATGVACRLDGPFLNRETSVMQDAKGEFEELLLFLPGDTDVTVKDAISNIRRKLDNEVLQADRLAIRKRDPIDNDTDEHHIELHLDKLDS